jgi:hypothetical protein
MQHEIRRVNDPLEIKVLKSSFLIRQQTSSLGKGKARKSIKGNLGLVL